jgi:hypothetical protein
MEPSKKLVEFRSPSRNLRVFIRTGIDADGKPKGFTKKFIDGVILIPEEEAELLRKDSHYGTSFVEVKRGQPTIPLPKSLEPTIVRGSPTEKPIATKPISTADAEAEFKESMGATDEEFGQPAQQIHVNTAKEDAAQAKADKAEAKAEAKAERAAEKAEAKAERDAERAEARPSHVKQPISRKE